MTTIYQPTATYEEYKETLTDAIDNDLMRHSYIAKSQAQYLNMTKETLRENEAIVIGDFAENYQFLIQDEIQRYHWSKARYILWLHTTREQKIAFNMIHCVLFLMTIIMMQALCIKFKQFLLIILKLMTYIYKN